MTHKITPGTLMYYNESIMRPTLTLLSIPWSVYSKRQFNEDIIDTTAIVGVVQCKEFFLVIASSLNNDDTIDCYVLSQSNELGWVILFDTYEFAMIV